MVPQITVVDIGPLRNRAPSGTEDVVEVIRDACGTLGFFQVVNHGVPDLLIHRVWEQTRNFFALSRDQKQSLARTEENPRGYYDRELTKNARDLKEVFDFGDVDQPHLSEDDPRNCAAVDGFNRWPDGLPEFKPTMQEYFRACRDLGLTILKAFCAGLGVAPDAVERHFVPKHTSFVRLNYYPLHDPLESEQAVGVTPLGDMALHHHTDAGALTILLQDDVGGLQVAWSGRWIDVEPIDGAFVINLGDMMQIWSNDRYRAALHRVLPRTQRERFSIPFFFNPAYETNCTPLEPLGREAPRYRPVNWGMFRQRRTDGDYADVGKEIQISDFRVGGH